MYGERRINMNEGIPLLFYFHPDNRQCFQARFLKGEQRFNVRAANAECNRSTGGVYGSNQPARAILCDHGTTAHTEEKQRLFLTEITKITEGMLKLTFRQFKTGILSIYSTCNILII
jgi:hypothetical protein